MRPLVKSISAARWAFVWVALTTLLIDRLEAQPFAPAEVGTTVNGFQDDFNGTSPDPNWVVRGANVYSVSDGVLHIASASGDPNHFLYGLPGYHSSVQEVLARMRVRDFGGGPYSRGGVAVAVDPGTGQGINHTFRDVNSEGQTGPHTALLDDFRAWGPGLNFVWQTNVWYWLRLRQEPNVPTQGAINDVFGKIWPADGAIPEPADWQVKWDYTPSRSTRAGYAGIMAGSTSGGLNDRAVFDVDYILIKAAGLPAIVVAPSGFVQTPVAITNQPQNQSVLELAPATFTVGVNGYPPPAYQWYRNNVLIPGATNAGYRIASCPLSDDGARFHVVTVNVVSNLAYSAASIAATLTVVADTQPPALLGARSLGLTLVQVFFSERVRAGSATTAAHYAIDGPGGGVNIVSATLDATQTNVLLNVGPLVENATYTLTVNGVADPSAAANVLVAGAANFTALQPAVFITEFMAENTVGLMDADGAHSDWIELQNQSSFAVDIIDWRLTDDPANLAQWLFPSTTLAPGQFLVVFASGEDRRTPGAELHTNFRLGAAGEYLGLIRADGTVAQEFTYGPQHKDASFGLVGNANLFMPTPTPGASNGPGVLGFVADTKFNPNRGFFTNAFSLSITSATAGAEIWFTTDGSVPAPGAAASTRYTSSLVISNTATLRATAFLAGYAPTDVDTHTFIFPASTARQPANPAGFPTSWNGYAADYEMDPQIVTNTLPGYDVTTALLSLPALSLVASRDDLFGATRGIYARSDQQGDDWEREASVELIFADGTPGFQAEAGLRVHGYTSRYHSTTLKHSLRISFRDRFGPGKLHFPLLPDAGVNDFDSLVLRACSSDSYPVVDAPSRWEAGRATYIRDQWMRDAMRDLGQITSHGRYVHLWLNGLYWGVYNLCETLDSGFAAQHRGGNKDEYDVIKDYFLIDEGNRLAWDAAAALATQGFATEAAYQLIQGNNPDGVRSTNLPVYLNLTNYVDYIMVHVTSGAIDWPMNNWWSCRRRGPESRGFAFAVWDQEESNASLTATANVFCMPFAEASEASCLSTPGEYHGAYFYDILRRTSPSFRQFFMDRAWAAHTGNGPLAPGPSAVRWLARQNEIDRAIVAETARWSDSRHEPPFTREGHWLAEMRWVANCWASNQVRAIQRYRSVGLWPVLGPPALSHSRGYFTNSLALTLTQTNGQGAIRYTLDGADPRAPGGAPSAGARVYSTPLQITTATRVRARVTDGTNWSPPVEATFLPLQALTNLVVTEIYYNPPGAAGEDGEAFEFLELQNRGAHPLDLSGLAFTAGIHFTFTNSSVLAPDGFFVLARDATNFASRFPDVPLQGLFTGKLDNDGEILRLQNAIGDPIFTFAYNDKPPWPASADGVGDSLHRIYFGDPTNAANWCPAAPTPGAPAPATCRDSDSDGLPDAWELAHGLNEIDPGGENGPYGDPDLDGLSNLQEFLAGTNPRDAQSYLKIESISFNSRAILTFNAVSNKSYTVQSTPALGGGPWFPLADIPARATNHVAVVIDPAAATNRFYRLTTRQQP